MGDFTSSNYLGFWHDASSLRFWSKLTLGVPAALIDPPGAKNLARRLARLQGCEATTLAKSTLHLFWDLFGVLASLPIVIYLDAGAYPTARWGVERAAARGVPVHRFPHKDATALRQALRRNGDGRLPVVVADGLCSCCGCAAPLAAYLDTVRHVGGLLVVDDTQALGLLGHAPDSTTPYGRKGGGSLRWCGISDPNILVVSSLAKAFGAPLSALSGSRPWIRRFEAQSETRVYCSPPSVADVHAALRALQMNAVQGDDVRNRLARRVHFFSRRLAEVGLDTDGGLFPVQTLKLPPDLDRGQLYRRLCRLGVRTVPRRDPHNQAPHISFILTAQHRPDEIAAAVQALVQAVNQTRQARSQLQTESG